MSVIVSRISALTGFYSTCGSVLQKNVKYIYWFHEYKYILIPS